MIHVHYNSGRIPALVVAASPFDFGGWEKYRRLIFFGWRCPFPLLLWHPFQLSRSPLPTVVYESQVDHIRLLPELIVLFPRAGTLVLSLLRDTDGATSQSWQTITETEGFAGFRGVFWLRTTRSGR